MSVYSLVNLEPTMMDDEGDDSEDDFGGAAARTTRVVAAPSPRRRARRRAVAASTRRRRRRRRFASENLLSRTRARASETFPPRAGLEEEGEDDFRERTAWQSKHDAKMCFGCGKAFSVARRGNRTPSGFVMRSVARACS